MKFLFAVNFLRDKNSGAAGNIIELADTLNKKGHAAHAFFRNDLAFDIKKNKLFHAAVFFLFPLIAAFKIFRLHSRNHYDFIIISNGDGLFFALFAKIILREKRPRIIMHSQGYEYLYKREFEIEKKIHGKHGFRRGERIWLLGFKLLEVKAFSHLCDSICCLSDKEKIDIEKLYPEKKIFATSISVDPVFMSREESKRERDILFVGGWCRMKGRDYLVDIINSLHKDMGGITVSLMGTGVDDGDVLGSFPQGARHKIRVVRFLPKNMLSREYRAHKVFLFPSLFEGYGNVVLEAMASGMAVVISEDLGVSGIIKSGYNGFLVKKRDTQGFAGVTKQLLNDEPLMKEIGENARATAGRMTWDNVADKFT